MCKYSHSIPNGLLFITMLFIFIKFLITLKNCCIFKVFLEILQGNHFEQIPLSGHTELGQ